MEFVSYIDFRKGVGKFLDKVNDDESPLLITRQNSKPVVLMSLKEFNSYEETLYLLSSSKNAERLRRSIADTKLHEVTNCDLVEK